MADNENNNKRNSLKNSPPERLQPKVLVIWLAIFASIVALWYFNPGSAGKGKAMNIQTVIEAAQGGDVSEGAIKSDPTGGKDWVVLTGKIKNPERSGAESIPFRAEGRLTDENFALLQKTSVFKEARASTLLTQFLFSMLPFVLIIGLLYFLFVRQLKNAGRGAMSFGKSRAKMLTRDRERLSFKSVAGCDEAKEEVGEVVEFLRDPKKFQKMGARIPKGILMVGPPGTGKTLLAKAVAGEADVPFFSISGSDFVEMFVGVGASRVRDMFEQGRKHAPCLVFIGEIDAVGRQRGAGLGGGNDEREQTLNSLLVEMDGFDANEGVIIIAATNRPDVLDSALLRPGRFDRQVYIDLPDLIGREEILKVHSKKLPLADTVDLKTIARGTPGLSGADLANLLNESALMAARRNKKTIEPIDIEDAKDKVQFGRERRRIMDDEDKKIVAYHEAGHALVQALLDDGDLPVHKVTIIPRGGSLGSTMFIPKKDTYNYAKRRMLIQLACLMGGRIAEEIVLGDITSGASGDIKMATKLARQMVCEWEMSPLGPIAFGDNQDTVFLGRDIGKSQNVSESTAMSIDSEIKKLIDEQYARATELIIEKREALNLIAESLLEYETLEGKHVSEIIEFGEIRSEVIRQEPAASSKEKKEDVEPKISSDKDNPDTLPPPVDSAHTPA
ncbi:MAG: ATP-dependent zinc metalloprotease FtsH [Opitutaceae bacterium]|nr:ATP-dependent zinc metalloprotease FtsH [Opitutaceae bacterium]